MLEHLQAMRADMAVMKADIAAIKTEQRSHSRTLNILVQDGRLLRAAVNDIGPRH